MYPNLFLVWWRGSRCNQVGCHPNCQHHLSIPSATSSQFAPASRPNTKPNQTLLKNKPNQTEPKCQQHPTTPSTTLESQPFSRLLPPIQSFSFFLTSVQKQATVKKRKCFNMCCRRKEIRFAGESGFSYQSL